MPSTKKCADHQLVSIQGLHVRETPQGVVLTVEVHPRASRSQIAGVQGGHLRIRCTAPPEGGKANEQCVGLLACALKVPPSRVAIVRGTRSRIKTVLLRECTSQEVMEHLGVEEPP